MTKIRTLDDPDWDGQPFDYTKSPEKLEAKEVERQQLYPSKDKASYLKCTRSTLKH